MNYTASLTAQSITVSQKSWRLTPVTCFLSAHIPTSKGLSFAVCTSIQVSEVRKDEFKRLMDEGNEEETRMLKRSRYILTARRETLARKDA